nr:hypothetical protein [uncultured Sphingobacterium sp.]
MKMKFIKRIAVVLLASVGLLIGVSSCKKDEHVPVAGEEVRASLQFTELLETKGAGHGDHFHGVTTAKEGAVITVNFDASGNALTKGAINLDAELAYKIDLKVYDEKGIEIQDNFVKNQATAGEYKAFLIGDKLIANANTETNGGAIFQPRETDYADGTKVNGKYEMTGLKAFFTLGSENKGKTKKLIYSLRKIEPGVKATIERVDLLDPGYASKFKGANVLELKFDIK